MDTKPQGLDGEFARRVIKLMAAVNVRVYKLTRGRFGGTWRVGAGWRNPVPICLLEHRGRRTGKLRTTPLVYLEDADRVVVVASQAGRRHHPLWFRNIEADPDVTVQIRGERRLMRARTADAEERAALWPRLVDLYSDYDSYQSWTDREIPVVLLEPR
jgi:deazaflavin-dependent oxidoreductase (nitroreductase family)